MLSPTRRISVEDEARPPDTHALANLEPEKLETGYVHWHDCGMPGRGGGEGRVLGGGQTEV